MDKTIKSSNAASVPSEAFGYDKLGNWTTDSRVHNAANELVEDSSYTYTYDDDGNLVQKQSKANAADVTTYTWDALNRLTNVHTPVAQVDYGYDALGRRASRTQTDVLTNQSKITRFVYDGDNVRLEVDGGGTVLAANTHAGLDRMLARMDFSAGTRYFLHSDALNSTLALTDTSGSVVERYRYSTYGQLQVLSPTFAIRTSSPLVPYTYTGRDWDPVASLYNYRARYYSGHLGRFISTDSIGFASGDVNLYAYVGNAPETHIDPSGHLIKFADGANPFLYSIAKGYVSVDSRNATNFSKVETSATVYTIVQIYNGNERFNPNNNTIYWDPTSALRTTEGGEQTPALGLGHEVDHAANRNPFLANMPDPAYGNWEERRVIEGSETSAAVELGEAVRTNHDGTPYVTSGPLSTTPLTLSEALNTIFNGPQKLQTESSTK